MHECGNRVVKQHPRSGIAHDGTHLFTHPRVITMDGALLAGRFAFSEPAMRQARVCIFRQLLAIGAKRGVAFLVTAIQGNHLFHHAFFMFDT